MLGMCMVSFSEGPPTLLSLESLPPPVIRQTGVWPTRRATSLALHAPTHPRIHTLRHRGTEALIHSYIERSIHWRGWMVSGGEWE